MDMISVIRHESFLWLDYNPNEGIITSMTHVLHHLEMHFGYVTLANVYQARCQFKYIYMPLYLKFLLNE